MEMPHRCDDATMDYRPESDNTNNRATRLFSLCFACVKRQTSENPSYPNENTIAPTEKMSIELQVTSPTRENLPSPKSPSPTLMNGTDEEISDIDDLPSPSKIYDLQSTSTFIYNRHSTRTISGTFSEQFNLQEDDVKWKGMIKSHYVDKKSREKCRGCSKKFKLKRRPRHCRRCGELFCIKCLRYKRRLNKMAQPDPEGTHRKVCQQCYNEDAQVLGHTRNWTDEFNKERKLSKYERIVHQRVNSKTQTFWRDQLDISTECRRLLDGFERNVGKSESKKTMQELRGLMVVPDWQKSRFWQVENVTSHCRQCKKSRGVRKSRRNCKVCSLALCKKCSHKELLVYYDDECQNGNKRAKLALINVNGCPSQEPNISLMLYVCSECKNYIREKQEDNQAWYDNLRDDSPLAEINKMDTLFMKLTNQITHCLHQFEDQDQQDSIITEGSNELTLLGNHLDKFHTLFKSLQHVLERAESKPQHTFIKNYTKGKYDFYIEARHEYRKLCRQPE